MLPFQLESGVFLEGAHVLIPWNTKFSDLHSLGKPLESGTSQTIRYSYSWQDDACFGGLAVDMEAIQVIGAPDPRAFHIYLDRFHWARFWLHRGNGEPVRDQMRRTFQHLRHHFGDPQFYYPEYAGSPAFFWEVDKLKLNLGCDFGNKELCIGIMHEPPGYEDLKREAARITAEEGRGELREYAEGIVDL